MSMPMMIGPPARPSLIGVEMPGTAEGLVAPPKAPRRLFRFGRQEEEAPKVPQGNLPDFAPDSAPEPLVALESGGQPLRKKGKTVTPAASIQPEAPDSLLEALNGASIKEEHRTVMSAVIQKVQLAKSRLTEACSSLLTGFEVRILIYVK